MTQAQFAKQIGTSQQFVSLLLHDKRKITWEIAKKIVQVFGQDAEYWMEASGDQIRSALNGNE